MAQINWFEIPATDFARAVAFYNTVLATNLREEVFMDVPNAIFMTAEGRGIGAVINSPEFKPSSDGSIVYLDATGRLDEALALAESNGGSVLQPRTSIGPMGWIAMIRDSEGNRVALHEEPR